MAVQNNVPKPPLQTPVINQGGRMSKAWAIFFRELYNWTAYKGGNGISDIDLRVETNTEDIIAADEAITINADAIAQNVTDIAANAANIDTLETELDEHILEEEAHGANGDIVGNNDFATELIGGVVLQMDLVADASDSSVNVSGSNPGSAGANYDQTYAQSQTDLLVECKNDINQLVSDLNDVVAVLNELIAESKTAKQMNTV